MNDVTRDGDFDAARGQRPARHDSPISPIDSLRVFNVLVLVVVQLLLFLSVGLLTSPAPLLHFVIAKMRIVIIGIKIIKIQCPPTTPISVWPPLVLVQYFVNQMGGNGGGA